MTETIIGLSLFAAAIAAAVALGLAWRAHRLLDERETRLSHDKARISEMLGIAPDGHICWTYGPDGEQEGEATVSRRLAILLDLFKGTEAGFSDVLGALRTNDGMALERSVERLHEDGSGFEMELALKDGGRRVLAYGLRAADNDGTPLADVVWMRDITDGVAGAYGLAREKEKLEGEVARLKGLLDALPFPAWLRDENLSLIYCNVAYARAVDMPTPKAALAEGWELAPGEGAREARALAARARAADEPRSHQLHLVMDGQRRLFELTEAPVAPGEDGVHHFTAGIAIDISPLEESQGDLSRHLSAHAMVLQNLPTALAIFDTQTRLTFRNRAFDAMWPLDTLWLDHKPSYSAYLDQLREKRLLPEVANYPAFKDKELKRFTGLIESAEDLQHLPDGTTLLRSFTPHPMGGLMVTYEDVTDLLALERSYNTMLQIQGETLDHLSQAVAVFSEDGYLRLINAVFREMWEIDPESLSEDTVITQVLERQRTLFSRNRDWEGLKAALIGRVGAAEAQAGRFERVDGLILTYLVYPLSDGGTLLTFTDVTTVARTEKALRERAEALKSADRMKSAFIANVSFELRTPLTTLIGFSELLEKPLFGELNDRQQEYLRGMLETARGLEQVVDGIVDLASIEAGEATLQLDAFDIHSMIDSILKLVTERVKHSALNLIVDVPDRIGWMVGDETRIKQVLFNLVANAVKYTPEGGRITVSAALDKGDILFTVADTGIGIPKADQARVFDAFNRGYGAHEAGERPGAGLGLTIVKRFVELHGGSVTLASEPGKGTTVTCRLPSGAGASERQLSMLDGIDGVGGKTPKKGKARKPHAAKAKS